MKVIAFEKVSFSDIPNRKFFNALTVDDKDYLHNRDNVRLTIQMELSQKQKTFSLFFFSFLKPILNFTRF